MPVKPRTKRQPPAERTAPLQPLGTQLTFFEKETYG